MIRCLAVLCLLLACVGARALSPACTLLVYNSANDQSIALAAYYGTARGIPAANRIAVAWSATEGADTATSAQAAALDTAIRSAAVRAHCDVIVLCRNLPTRISGAGSLDSRIASDGHGSRMNPYFMRTVPFGHSAFGAYIVTRLDGWSWADAQALVDRASAATPVGSILLDKDPAKSSGGYAGWQYQLGDTATKLGALGVPVTLESTSAFATGQGLAGYASWGSNDSHFSAAAYAALTFAPGAYAVTAVSTCGARIRTQGTGGQSQVSQLVRQGLTGVVGYVAEPMLSAIAWPTLLFPASVAGRPLGEAFMTAQPYLGWMDVVLGDPLCNPYATKGR